MKIVVIGEILWDLTPKGEFLGGAPLNFALHARTLGHDPLLVSAVGTDERGSIAIAALESRGISSSHISQIAEFPTGAVTVEFDSHGQPAYKIHRPAAYDFPSLTGEQLETLAASHADWIYFGTLQQMSSPAHALAMEILGRAPGARRFYDLNLRPDNYTRDLIHRLLPLADVLKLNEKEALELQHLTGVHAASHEQLCRELARRFDLEAVCVTRGARGCALFAGDHYTEAAGYAVEIADAIGAGDAFSAALLHGISAQWHVEKVADFANRVGALVAGRSGGAPHWTLEEAAALACP